MTEALMQLWQRCFGDGPEDIRAFGGAAGKILGLFAGGFPQ